MEAVILILALLFVAFVALGVFVSVKAVKAAKRGVDRTISQARRTVEDTTLRARSLGQAGVPGELAQLRVRLRTSMRSTQDALQAGAAEDASLSESVALFGRLSAHGHELDAEIKHLERDPDRARVAERLPGLRERTEQITRSADSLRWAVRDRARKFAEDDLTALSAQIDVESGALRHWSAAEPAERPGQSGRTAETETGRPEYVDGSAGSGAATGGETPGGTAAGDGDDPTIIDQSWSDPPSSADTRAIEPPDLRRRTTYPWQQSAQKATRPARPETTN